MSGAGLLRYSQLRELIAKLDAEVADRREWVNRLAAKYGVVRLAESLTEKELAAQQERVDYALGRKFLPTIPKSGLMMDRQGNWFRTEPR